MWPVYVINMSDNTERMENCHAFLEAQGIAYTRFEAVNGNTLSEDEVAEVYDSKANDKKFRHPLLRGEVGCYLSHLELWKTIANDTAEGAIILEDDFSAANDLARVLASLCADTGDWGMAKLYTRRPQKKMLASRPLCQGRTLARPYQIPNTTLGYAIRKPAASRFLMHCLPFARPIDEDLKHFWEHGVEIQVVLPPPLGRYEGDKMGASIELERKAMTTTAPIRQGLVALRHRLTYLANLFTSRQTRF